VRVCALTFGLLAGGEYPSIVETAKSIGCSEKTIIRALKTEKKLLKKR